MRQELGVVLLVQRKYVAVSLGSKHGECCVLLRGGSCLMCRQLILVCGCLPVQQVQRCSDRDLG